METEKDRLLKRVQQKALIVEIVAFVVALGMSLAYLLSVLTKQQVTISSILKIIIYLTIVVTVLAGLIYFVTLIVWVIKNIYRNATGKTSLSKEYFERLDYMREHWGEPNTFLKKRIGSIKYFYDRPEIQGLVENGRLDILYDRHSELMNRFALNKNLVAIAQGIASSVIYAIFGAIVNHLLTDENSFSAQLMVVIGIIGIFATIFATTNLGNIWKGQGGSFVYELDTYELKILEEKIAEIEERIDMNEVEFKLERTRSVLNKEIMKKRRFLSLNSENTKDLECLQSLNISYSGELGTMYKKEREVDFPGTTKETRNYIIEQDSELKILYGLLTKYGFKD